MSRPSAVAAVTVALLMVGCDDDPTEPADTAGTLRITVATTGATLDADGYTVELDGAAAGSVGTQGTFEFASLEPGDHVLALTGVAPNCAVATPHPRTVAIALADTVAAAFQVACDSALQNVIVFSRIHDGTSTIYWIAPEGSTPQVILDGAFGGAVSPDGRQIAFTRYTSGASIWRMNVDGSGLVELTDPYRYVSQSPSWSPDGQRIAFATNRDGNFEIYTMRADGSDPVRLTVNATEDQNPIWSPDGTRIAWTHEVEDGTLFQAFLMQADGSGMTPLSDNPDGSNALAWSPDGQYLLLVAGYYGLDLSNEIVRVRADGSDPVNLSNHPANEEHATYAPTGDAILFTSDRSGLGLAIYRAAADGQDPVELTTPGFARVDLRLQWLP